MREACVHCIHYTTAKAWINDGNKIEVLKIESDKNGTGLNKDMSTETIKNMNAHVCQHYRTTFFTMKESCPSRRGEYD